MSLHPLSFTQGFYSIFENKISLLFHQLMFQVFSDALEIKRFQKFALRSPNEIIINTALSFSVSRRIIAASLFNFPNKFPGPSYVCERYIIGSKVTFFMDLIKKPHQQIDQKIDLHFDV